jgi:predicted amidohydrolase
MPNPTTPVRVAIVQHAPVFLNLDASLARAEALVAQAAGDGAQVIAFPEAWLPGYPVWLDVAPQAALWDHPPAKAVYRLLVENALAIPGPHIDRLRAMARRAGAYLVMGVHERRGGTLYNTTLYIDRDGAQVQVHRKLVPTYTERLVWGRGDGSTLSVLDTACGVLGGLICWEHWMPLARAAMHAQHEVLHVAQWPSVKDLHQLASRHYAFEGQCFVLAAGCVLSREDVIEGARSLGPAADAALELLHTIPGEGGDLILRGGSAIIGPDASYVAGPVFDRAQIVCAEIDPRRVTEGRLVLDTDGHYARPDVFHLDVDTRPQARVRFLRDEERRR